MTPEKIENLLRESGLHDFLTQELPSERQWKELDRLLPIFVELVTADESEECAKVAISHCYDLSEGNAIATAIRARKEKT